MFSLFTGCGSPALNARTAGILRGDEPLENFSQFKVIDDFNSGQLKNKAGFPWEINPAGKLSLAADKSDARHKGRGHSLNVSFKLDPGDQASIKNALNRLDISRAEFLSFKCRIESASSARFSGKLEVSLIDRFGSRATEDITADCKKQRWRDAIIPLSKFRGLNFDSLQTVEFHLQAVSKGVQGNLWIDEVAFMGEENVEFESNRDNILGFPAQVLNLDRKAALAAEPDQAVFLKKIAQDTWKYFLAARDRETNLILDSIRVGEAPLAARYTSPTNIALDLMGHVAAFELGLISRVQAVQSIRMTLATLSKLERWKGFFYNYYDTHDLSIIRPFVSSVDCGWLAISLVVVRQTFKQELFQEASKFLDEFDFEEFLDPGTNQLVIGYDAEKGELVENHYGLLASEARATSFYAIGKGDLPREHWWFLYRTPPETWRWQTQVPKGEYKVIENMDVFEGYYEYLGKKFLPSWGGSLFEFLMPTLVMKERELAPHGLGLNNRITLELHRDYALKEKKYPLWGISPASTSNGRQGQYLELGIKALGVKGYSDRAIVTPHVSFLALDSLPQDAIANIRRFLNYDIYGEYGFYDSLDLKRQKANPQYLALDQGMILVTIVNYLKDGVIQNRFHSDSIGKKAESVLMKESFFNS